MTGTEFVLNAAANALGSTVGAAAGVMLGLHFDRKRQASADAKAEVLRHAELQASQARLAGEIASKQERRRQDVRAIVAAIDSSIESNVAAILRAEHEVSLMHIAMYSAFDLFSWNALHARVVDLLEEPALVGRLARFFANLQAFETLVDVHRRQDVSYSRQMGLEGRIVQMGPELREEAEPIRSELRNRFTNGRPETP